MVKATGLRRLVLGGNADRIWLAGVLALVFAVVLAVFAAAIAYAQAYSR